MIMLEVEENSSFGILDLPSRERNAEYGRSVIINWVDIPDWQTPWEYWRCILIALVE